MCVLCLHISALVCVYVFSVTTSSALKVSDRWATLVGYVINIGPTTLIYYAKAQAFDIRLASSLKIQAKLHSY